MNRYLIVGFDEDTGERYAEFWWSDTWEGARNYMLAYEPRPIKILAVATLIGHQIKVVG